MENLFDFFIRFGKISSEIGRLLGTNFVPGAASNATPMGLAQQRIMRLWNTGRRDEAEWELGRLGFLMIALLEVEKADPEMLKRFARRPLSHDAMLYFGTWHDVAIAASLLGRGEKLEHEPPGGPDFLVRGSGVGLECTSAHIAASLTATDLFVIAPDKPGERDRAYKLVSKIREKATKPYAASNVLLAIDATNLSALSGSEQLDISPAEEALETSGFGAMLVMSTIVNLDKDPWVIERGYQRRDASTIATDLRTFLDRRWPKGEKVVERHATPLIP